ncbi:COP9 signalosome complex subunit 5 [Trichinella patagoniensis]|uniref:COP9 signalosome complex subunit 5 n=1 Tax=Trichinella patagoniensis TaxID=990121 RepID=A0A0V1A9D4_9BILA|nr:COP9 signalosome complex subunit 5 [Trichinella patagoniensis]
MSDSYSRFSQSTIKYRKVDLSVNYNLFEMTSRHGQSTSSEVPVIMRKGDELFADDNEFQNEMLRRSPWKKDPHYFKRVQMSTLTLMKISNHAQSGNGIEVMGLLLGKPMANTFVILDSFALPVEGTETRVNAHEQAYEYMVSYLNGKNMLGRMENVIGWYHSHPGYGCWLSGIDVDTQMLHQMYEEPFVAVVIDPCRTLCSGKVDIGAFRTYPEHYQPADDVTNYESIPMDKIKDFGVHCKRYYKLDIDYFSSSMDTRLLELMTKNNWINVLSTDNSRSDQHFATYQIRDLTNKLDELCSVDSPKARNDSVVGAKEAKANAESSSAVQLLRDVCHCSNELLASMFATSFKQQLFCNAGGVENTNDFSGTELSACEDELVEANESNSIPSMDATKDDDDNEIAEQIPAERMDVVST